MEYNKAHLPPSPLLVFFSLPWHLGSVLSSRWATPPTPRYIILPTGAVGQGAGVTRTSLEASAESAESATACCLSHDHLSSRSFPTFPSVDATTESDTSFWANRSWGGYRPVFQPGCIPK